ncbi:unnamed protein product [Cyprideis torosa]|uniref:Uncharacterized protein n=1 Tax=Cyprideis torosa TaxID=163714 RepID=A0A7R8ZH52_9CRUS|nr:unnamed protein product [Cyprideis torosa]CAG0882868.1 unnamed protein product [Cyprideis torosa]
MVDLTEIRISLPIGRIPTKYESGSPYIDFENNHGYGSRKRPSSSLDLTLSNTSSKTLSKTILGETATLKLLSAKESTPGSQGCAETRSHFVGGTDLMIYLVQDEASSGPMALTPNHHDGKSLFPRAYHLFEDRLIWIDILSRLRFLTRDLSQATLSGASGVKEKGMHGLAEAAEAPLSRSDSIASAGRMGKIANAFFGKKWRTDAGGNYTSANAFFYSETDTKLRVSKAHRKGSSGS